MPASSGDDRPPRVRAVRRLGASLLLAVLALVPTAAMGVHAASASGASARDDRGSGDHGRGGDGFDDHGSGGHGSGDGGSDDHGSDDHGSDDHGSDDHGSDDHGSGDHGSGDDHDDGGDPAPPVPVVQPAETPTVVVPVATPPADPGGAASVPAAPAEATETRAPLAPVDRVPEVEERAVVEPSAEAGPRTPPPLSSGTDTPLAPFVPDGGWGWGIVGALAAAAVAGFVVRHATLRGAIREAQWSATRDPLTGLANRRLFDEILARELLRSRRRATPLALLLVDLDGFKRVNDSRGHAAGDAVLRSVAVTVAGRVRGSDLPARLGGDEFAVVLTECTAVDARRIGDTLAADIAAATGGSVTASVGVAGAPEHAEDAGDLIAAADAALYRAKAEGRNRVVLAGSDTPSAT